MQFSNKLLRSAWLCSSDELIWKSSPRRCVMRVGRSVPSSRELHLHQGVGMSRSSLSTPAPHLQEREFWKPGWGGIGGASLPLSCAATEVCVTNPTGPLCHHVGTVAAVPLDSLQPVHLSQGRHLELGLSNLKIPFQHTSFTLHFSLGVPNPEDPKVLLCLLNISSLPRTDFRKVESLALS